MNTLTFRTTLWFAALVTATLIVVLVLGGWALERQMVRGVELLHALEAEELAEMLGADGSLTDEQMRSRIAGDADRDAQVFYIQVHDGEGAVRFRSLNLGAAFLPDLTGAVEHRTVRLPRAGLLRVSEVHRGPWHIQIASSLEPSQLVVNDYVKVASLLVLGGALASVGLGWAFSRVTLAPIREIERAARQIGANNLSERIVEPPGRDELASLTRLLNKTFGRIEAAFGQVRQFTADASHELKTPLALIRLNAEKVRGQLAGQPASAAALDDVLEEIDRLHQIIEHLLFLSKADGGVLALKTEQLRLPEWLETWAEDARVLAEDRGCRFELRAESAGSLAGSASLLRQLLFNVLTNALKFSESGGLVTLRIRLRGEGWEWVLEDEGPGLPPAQLGRIFDRFVRFERADGQAPRPGHGLGLAICRSIVDLHHGTIHAENRADRPGLRMVIRLPRN